MATTFGKNLQTTIGRNPDQGYAGQIREAITVASYIYPYASSAQVATVTIGAVVASTNYTVSVNNTAITVNSAALTNVLLADALALALRRNAIAGGRYVVTSAAGVITMAHRQSGVNEVVTVFGGAATATSVASVPATYLPLGLVCAQGLALVDNELPTLKLPTAATDIIAGIGGVFAHNDTWVRDASGAAVRGINPGSTASVVKKGNIFVFAESPIAAGSQLFFRHTINGALNQLGAVAGAAGTGLAPLLSAVASASSFVISNGTNVCAIDINQP
jgi:hypothetical protein